MPEKSTGNNQIRGRMLHLAVMSKAYSLSTDGPGFWHSTKEEKGMGRLICEQLKNAIKSIDFCPVFAKKKIS